MEVKEPTNVPPDMGHEAKVAEEALLIEKVNR